MYKDDGEIGLVLHKSILLDIRQLSEHLTTLKSVYPKGLV